MKNSALAMLVLATGTVQAVGAGYGLLNVGIDYFNQERYADAVTWLDKAIAAGDLTSDQLHVAHLDRGIALARVGQAQKAVSDYDAALTIKPDDLQVIEGRAFVYIAADEPEKAVADILELQKKRPHDITISIQRGLLYWQLGRYAEASDAFSLAVSDGNSPFAWLWLQLANLKQNKDATFFKDQKSDQPEPHFKPIAEGVWPAPLISFYAGEKSESDIVAELSKSGENDGNLCDANFYIAEWHMIHGEQAAARPLMEKAASDCPKNFAEHRMAEFELKKMS